MQRVLSIATTGLFLAGLAMVPLSARADQALVGGKTVVPATHTNATMTPKPVTSGVTSTDPVKNDDKVTATPGTTAGTTHGASSGPAPGMTHGGATHGGTTQGKTPGKGAS